MNTYNISERNRVKRIPKRGQYDHETVNAILDAGFVCTTSFSIDGQPFGIPTAYGRDEQTIFVHGASTSRMLMHLQQEDIPVCLTVTHLDGIVVARSTFHSSMNYRSVVIFGKATLVEGEEKRRGLEIITNQILKGRWDEARLPNPIEMKATSVLKIEIEEASAKVRTGGANDEAEDYALPIWAGVIPIYQTFGQPIADEKLPENIPIAPSVKPFYTS